MNGVVVGVIGKQCSGKGTVIECLKHILKNKRIDHVKSGSGGILDDFLKSAGSPITRENQQKMAAGLRKYFGDDFISNTAGDRIRKSFADVAIYDAIRWEYDEKMIRSFNWSLILAVDADKELRFHRCKNRPRGDEKDLTREQFEKAEVASTEIEIDRIAKRADFTILNNEGLDSLELDVEFFCKKHGLLYGG